MHLILEYILGQRWNGVFAQVQRSRKKKKSHDKWNSSRAVRSESNPSGITVKEELVRFQRVSKEKYKWFMNRDNNPVRLEKALSETDWSGLLPNDLERNRVRTTVKKTNKEVKLVNDEKRSLGIVVISLSSNPLFIKERKWTWKKTI